MVSLWRRSRLSVPLFMSARLLCKFLPGFSGGQGCNESLAWTTPALCCLHENQAFLMSYLTQMKISMKPFSIWTGIHFPLQKTKLTNTSENLPPLVGETTTVEIAGRAILRWSLSRFAYPWVFICIKEEDLEVLLFGFFSDGTEETGSWLRLRTPRTPSWMWHQGPSLTCWLISSLAYNTVLDLLESNACYLHYHSITLLTDHRLLTSKTRVPNIWEVLSPELLHQTATPNITYTDFCWEKS